MGSHYINSAQEIRIMHIHFLENELENLGRSWCIFDYA